MYYLLFAGLLMALASTGEAIALRQTIRQEYAGIKAVKALMHCKTLAWLAILGFSATAVEANPLVGAFVALATALYALVKTKPSKAEELHQVALGILPASVVLLALANTNLFASLVFESGLKEDTFLLSSAALAFATLAMLGRSLEAKRKRVQWMD